MAESWMWDEDKLEPRVGLVSEVRGHTYKVDGCSPRVGDWVRVAHFDTLVLKVNEDGFNDAFPFFRIRPAVGDEVVIIGSVGELG